MNRKKKTANEASTKTFPKYGEQNCAGVWWARKGYYKGKEVTVTHRDPKSGQVYLEDYKEKDEYGLWVNNDSVTYK